jgi:hypothetical protein
VFRFVADVASVPQMNSMFCEGLGARIALATCETITQSREKIGTIGQIYEKFMRDARLQNFIETGPVEPPMDDWLACGSSRWAAPHMCRRHFLGGEFSQAAQGRIDLPTYRTGLNVCLNAIPIESGAWQRRGGTQHCGLTRGGLAAKLIGFDFEQPFPYQIEVSAGFFRYWSEPPSSPPTTMRPFGDLGANPAVITTTAAHGWSTADQVRVNSNVKTLLRRDSRSRFCPHHVLHRGCRDRDGDRRRALDAFTSGTVARIAETASPYTGDLWRNRALDPGRDHGDAGERHAAALRAHRHAAAERCGLCRVRSGAGDLLDGPYLDPIPGSWATASALSGNVTITLSFQTYDAASPTTSATT